MRESGFTLIEVIVTVAILAILAGIMVPSVYRLWENNEIDITTTRMKELKKAMAGDRSMVQNGIRTHYGYVGDCGELPATLGDLATNSGSCAEWRGPYLASGFDPVNFNKDAWGNSFAYTVSTDGTGRQISAVMTSAGPDQKFGTADDIADPEFQVAVKDVTPTAIMEGNVSFVFSAYSTPSLPYTAKIRAAYRLPSGNYSDFSDSCIPVNTGRISGNQSRSVTQHFTATFPAALPVGKILVRTLLYKGASCSTFLQESDDMAVFVSDGLNTLSVNPPTISYSVN